MKFVLHTQSKPGEVIKWLNENIDPERRLPHKIVLNYRGKVGADNFKCKLRNDGVPIIHKGIIFQEWNGTRIEIKSGFGLIFWLVCVIFLVPLFAILFAIAYTIWSEPSSAYPLRHQKNDVIFNMAFTFVLFLIPLYIYLKTYITGQSYQRKLHLEMRLAFKETQGEYI